jgi:glucan 1,3-beta-glucosidase
MRNLTFHNSGTAIQQLWDWGWTYKGISINNCGVGLNMSSIDTSNDINAGAQTVGSVAFIDSEINNTPVGILMARGPNSTPLSGGSLILENVRINNVPSAVKGPQGTVLSGSAGQSTIAGWGQGHSYTPNGPNTFQNSISATNRPSSLTAGTDYYEHSKPQYENIPASDFVSVRTQGAKGDGVTDDSDTLNAILSNAAQSGKIVYFDAGTYLVKKTVFFPAGVHIVGESYSVIMSSGSFFASKDSPKAVVQVGTSGQNGHIEWSDMIVSTQGAQAGAILIEYNLASPSSLPSGIWDVHTRVGGFAGSKLQLADCPKTPSTVIVASNLAQNCIAAFLSVHITSLASGLYMENNWLWVADHDVEDANVSQITIYAGRGLLIESVTGGIWLVGTAVEHHQMYQYQLANTKDIFMGQIQTETAYYQPNPDATIPFASLSAYHDPVFSPGDLGWGVRVVDSSNILVYGAGLYSFFSNYNLTCSNQGNGETCQNRVLSVDAQSTVKVYNLNTVGVTKMATVAGSDIASFKDNLNGFVDTIALLSIGGI